MRTAVALGSNVGDRLANMRAARKAITDLPIVKPPVVESPIYETDPVDCEPGAAKFLNAVIEFEYAGDPLQLLKELKAVESALGRPPEHARNISRKIDLDLLYFGDSQIDRNGLQLRHPRMHQRRFVLEPLADIRPELILPGQSKTVAQLLAQLDESGKVIRFTKDWEI